MYPTSTQLKHWTFKNEEEIQSHRTKANHDFIKRNSDKVSQLNSAEVLNYFLNENEEQILLQFYGFRLIEFYKQFVPKLPADVCGTAFHYMKRFYVHNSVMDFHPKEILVTCVYLACKIEEFNIDIDSFVGNIKGDRQKAVQVIINYEKLLLEKLNYHLLIHNIYKPMEGLLLDIKVRSKLKNVEKLSPIIETVIDKLYLTDACLLYSPSQISLAIVLHSASKNSENLDDYVTQTLFDVHDKKLWHLIEVIRKIRTLIVIADNLAVPSKEAYQKIEQKLSRCRCEENNPNSEIFKARLERLKRQELADENPWMWCT